MRLRKREVSAKGRGGRREEGGGRRMKGIIDSREADWPSGLIQLVELS
jgi:hypothetical protein